MRGEAWKYEGTEFHILTGSAPASCHLGTPPGRLTKEDLRLPLSHKGSSTAATALELTWCPTVFLCSLAVWPGLPLVGFEGMRVRGTRPEEVAEVGLMAFSSS